MGLSSLKDLKNLGQHPAAQARAWRSRRMASGPRATDGAASAFYFLPFSSAAGGGGMLIGINQTVTLWGSLIWFDRASVVLTTQKDPFRTTPVTPWYNPLAPCVARVNTALLPGVEIVKLTSMDLGAPPTTAMTMPSVSALFS